MKHKQLRSLFGSAIGADHIAFADFCILDEAGVGDLLRKVNDFGPRIKLLKLRKDAHQLPRSAIYSTKYQEIN
jgi:hypothetical protein